MVQIRIKVHGSWEVIDLAASLGIIIVVIMLYIYLLWPTTLVACCHAPPTSRGVCCGFKFTRMVLVLVLFELIVSLSLKPYPYPIFPMLSLWVLLSYSNLWLSFPWIYIFIEGLFWSLSPSCFLSSLITYLNPVLIKKYSIYFEIKYIYKFANQRLRISIKIQKQNRCASLVDLQVEKRRWLKLKIM